MSKIPPVSIYGRYFLHYAFIVIFPTFYLMELSPAGKPLPVARTILKRIKQSKACHAFCFVHHSKNLERILFRASFQKTRYAFYFARHFKNPVRMFFGTSFQNLRFQFCPLLIRISRVPFVVVQCYFLVFFIF